MAGSSTADGVAVYDCNATGAQKWTVSNGALVNSGAGKCPDAGSRSTVSSS